MLDSITLSSLLDNLATISPEMALTVAILGLIVAGLFLHGLKANRWMGGLALLASTVVFAAAAEQFWTLDKPLFPFSGMLVVDRLAAFFRLFVMAATVVVILATLAGKSIDRYRAAEYYPILLSTTLGMMFLAMSTNWLMFYLSLETLSLGSYVLAGYRKKDPESAEGAMKYFVYGGAASGVMLFGISYLYGITGTLEIGAVFAGGRPAIPIIIAMLMVFAGLGFKISAVPFHFWAPDVYQGAPTPITAYLAVASKAAGFLALLRVFLPQIGDLVFSPPSPLQEIVWVAVFWAASIVTMTLGNLVALRQKRLKRLLAYSSIAHAGYLMMALTVFEEAAIHGLLFYLVAYLIMNLGAFVVVVYLENRTGTDRIDAYRGLVYRAPLLVTVMAILLFSLTGLPPTVGFIGKILIFGAVIKEGIASPDIGIFYYILALAGAVNTAISLSYYMSILKVMVLQTPEGKMAESEPEPQTAPSSGGILSWRPSLTEALFLLAFAIPTLWYGVFWTGLQDVVSFALAR